MSDDNERFDPDTRALEADQRDAARWRAFLASDRINIWGWTEHGTAQMHFGAEFWITHPDRDAPAREGNRALLTAYADAAVAAQENGAPAIATDPERRRLRIRRWHAIAFRNDVNRITPIDAESDFTRDGPQLRAFLERYRDQPGRMSHVIAIFDGGEWL